jgi:hypothetical protein
MQTDKNGQQCYLYLYLYQPLWISVISVLAKYWLKYMDIGIYRPNFGKNQNIGIGRQHLVANISVLAKISAYPISIVKLTKFKRSFTIFISFCLIIQLFLFYNFYLNPSPLLLICILCESRSI